jgi:hypothetical protein
MTAKKRGFILLSAIPILLIVSIILIAGYLLLKDDIKLPWNDHKPRITRLSGFPTVVYTDKQLDKQRLIIKSETDLNNFLNNIDSTGMLLPKDKINFDKEYIIAVSSPTRNLAEHTIKIKKVYEDTAKKTYIVSVQEDFPADACAVTTDQHIAVDVVKINKTDYNFDFERIVNTKPCRN